MKTAIFAALAISTVAMATPASASDVSGTCRSSGMVGAIITCDARKDFSFQSNGEDKEYALWIKASPGHCSDVKFTVYSYDGRTIMGQTEWLAPNQQGTAFIGGGMAAGTQIVKIRADGRLGGCNTGRMQGWKANVRAYENE